MACWRLGWGGAPKIGGAPEIGGGAPEGGGGGPVGGGIPGMPLILDGWECRLKYISLNRYRYRMWILFSSKSQSQLRKLNIPCHNI